MILATQRADDVLMNPATELVDDMVILAKELADDDMMNPTTYFAEDMVNPMINIVHVNFDNEFLANDD